MSGHAHGEGGVISEEARRAKLAARLALRPDRNDVGQCLEATAAALALPSGSEEEAALRLEALVSALVSDRVILPVGVEADPRETGVHPDVAPDSCEAADFARVRVGGGEALCVYSSAAALAAARPQARPMPLDFRSVALTALVESAGRVVMDPGEGEVLLPRPAVAALAQGDEWLPAWRDAELAEDLAARAWPWGVLPSGVRVRPVRAGAVVRVELDVPMDAGEESSLVRVRAQEVVEAVGRCERLVAAADRVEFAPRPVLRAVDGV